MLRMCVPTVFGEMDSSPQPDAEVVRRGRQLSAPLWPEMAARGSAALRSPYSVLVGRCP
jgi:hypothetical protein